MAISLKSANQKKGGGSQSNNDRENLLQTFNDHKLCVHLLKGSVDKYVHKDFHIFVSEICNNKFLAMHSGRKVKA